MNRIVVLGPTTLLGKELVAGLESRPDLCRELTLLSLDAEEIGALTDAAGAAALVARAEPAAIAAADAVVVCRQTALYRELLAARPAGTTAVLLDPDADEPEAVPVVAGVNLAAAAPGRLLASPHPAVVLLAHLLAPLAAAGGVERAVVTLVQPASLFGRAGLDELFAQAGRLIALQKQEPSELFGRQLAFNLYPAPRPPARLTALVRDVLGAAELPLAARVLQGAVFHGFAALVHVHLAGDPPAAEVRGRLGGHPLIELGDAAADGGDLLGPIDAAAHDKVRVGPVSDDPDGGVWIWAVMDNLTRGGALNALALLEAVAAGGVH